MKANMDSSSTLREVEQAAATWLLKRDSDAWSAADQAELDRWLAASPGHRVSFIRLQSVWQNTVRLKSVGAGLPKGQVPNRGSIQQSPFFTAKRRDRGDRPESPAASASPEPGTQEAVEKEYPQKPARVRLYAVAASLLLALGAGIAAYSTGFLDRESTYSTPIGGLATVPTPDGSLITLNTNTAIEVRITEKERHITLKRGEAFFEVAKDRTKPFIVYASRQRVIAVGTKFSVRLSSDDLRVAVTEGKVRVEEQPALLDLSRLIGARNGDRPQPSESRQPGGGDASDTPGLGPGTVADIHRRHIDIQQQPVPELEQTLSWRAGYVTLRKCPLPEAVAEFNRYNTRQLVIADPALRDITVGGNFRSNNLDGFLRLLEQGFDIRAEILNDRIILKRAR